MRINAVLSISRIILEFIAVENSLVLPLLLLHADSNVQKEIARQAFLSISVLIVSLTKSDASSSYSAIEIRNFCGYLHVVPLVLMFDASLLVDAGSQIEIDIC